MSDFVQNLATVQDEVLKKGDFQPQDLNSIVYNTLLSICRLKTQAKAVTADKFQELKGLFDALEALAGRISPRQWNDLLSNKTIGETLPDVYAIRADMEYSVELSAAREMLSSVNPKQAVTEAVRKKISMLSPIFFAELEDRKRILFVGSGPFPTTAMAIVEMLQCPVVCLDRNGSANSIARDFVTAGGMSKEIGFIEGSLEQFDDVVLYDSIVCAFLLGVDTVATPRNTKSRLVNDTAGRLAPGARMLLRTPMGAGELIYPKVDFAVRPGFLDRDYPARTDDPQPYDLPFKVIEREKAEASNGR